MKPLTRKRNLTEEQESQRLEGLRVLARIIARHYLAHPELYLQPSDAEVGGAKRDSNEKRKEGAE